MSCQKGWRLRKKLPLFCLLVGLAVEVALRWWHRSRSEPWHDKGLRPETRALWEMAREGGKRIVVIGDSIPYGQGVADGEAYPDLLRAWLRERHPDIQSDVINVGIPGNTVLQGWARLERHVLRYQPDLVIVHFGLNDAKLSRSAVDEWRERCFWFSLKPWGRVLAIPQRSYLCRAILARIGRWRYRVFVSRSRVDKLQPRVSLRAFCVCLRMMIEQIHRRAKAAVILLTMSPVGEQSYASWTPEWREKQRDLYDEYNAQLHSVVSGTGAYLVDVSSLFLAADSLSLLAADGIHWTAAGHRLVAESLLGLAERVLFRDSSQA